jgi:O-antigen/teichoic acid export membrane protein
MINQTAVDTTDELQELLDSDQPDAAAELAAIKKKSVSGVLSFFLRTLFIQAIGLVSALVLSAYLSPADFGVYGFVIQIIGILIFFSDVGLAAALIQKKQTPSLTDYRTAFTAQSLLSWAIVAAVVALIASGFVEQKVGQSGVWVLLSLGLSFPLATLQTVSRIKLERELDFSKLVIPQIIEQVVFNGLLIWLAIKGVGAMSYAYAIIARSVIGAVTMFWLAPWEIGLSWNPDSLKELMGYGIKFQVNDFLARIKDQLFFLVVGTWFPLAEFGYINWAKNWSVYPYNLTVQNVMAITFPAFSRLQGHQAALKRAIEKTVYFISLFIFPVLVGMCVFVFPLVELVPRYDKWQPALLSLVFFSLSIAWGAISTPLTNTLNAIGHINTTLKLMVMWTVLTWVISPTCMYFFGYQGVAISAFIISFSSFASIYYVKKLVNFDAWGNVWQPLLAATVMAGVSVAGLPLWQQNFFWLAGGVAVAGLTYLAILLLVGRTKFVTELQSLVAYRK